MPLQNQKAPEKCEPLPARPGCWTPCCSSIPRHGCFTACSGGLRGYNAETIGTGSCGCSQPHRRQGHSPQWVGVWLPAFPCFQGCQEGKGHESSSQYEHMGGKFCSTSWACGNMYVTAVCQSHCWEAHAILLSWIYLSLQLVTIIRSAVKEGEWLVPAD